MSINKPLFDEIYDKCLLIINQSSDKNIKKKKAKLCATYNELCKTKDHAISEELQKDYCCLLLNPFAKLPIDETKLKGVKYFLLSAVDQQYITYRWVNP